MRTALLSTALLGAALPGAALASPGRATASLTAGPNLDLADFSSISMEAPRATSVHGSVDYGLRRRLALSAEFGGTTHPDPHVQNVHGGMGPLLELVDQRWWRVGLLAAPELALLDPMHPGEARIEPRLRVGTRVSWLAFWGVALTLRVDAVATPSHALPTLEAAPGLAIRL